MNRYRPEATPRVLALLASVSFTAIVLAGVHAEAQPQQAAALAVNFTGEVTAHGPVYRMPGVEVRAGRGDGIELTDLIGRALGGFPHGERTTAKPNA